MANISKIRISAKCSDLFAASAYDDNGKQVGASYDGYVPTFMPGEHYGDYVDLLIDVKTGRILNWKEPKQTELEKVFDEKG